MKYLFLFLIILSGCNKPKTVLICGDHICVNKNEAKQYFEENLTIEVKILDKKVKKKIDLVELNLKENNDEKRSIKVFSKKNSNKKLKVLSDEEISNIKKNIKIKNKKKKFAKKILKKNDDIKVNIENSNNTKNIKYNNLNKENKEIVDICTIIEKCSIDEITKYLLKEGKKRNFPDITLRQ